MAFMIFIFVLLATSPLNSRTVFHPILLAYLHLHSKLQESGRKRSLRYFGRPIPPCAFPDLQWLHFCLTRFCRP